MGALVEQETAVVEIEDAVGRAPRSRVEVSTSAVEENTRLLCSHVAPSALIAVLKGDAYGHGLVPCAGAARRGGAGVVAVGDIGEAAELRRAGDDGAVLLLGPVVGESLTEALLLDVEVEVSTASALFSLAERARGLGRRARVHLSLDTGLGREGFAPEDFPEVLGRLRRQEELALVGVMSHLSAARDADSSRGQLAEFTRAADGLPPQVTRHLANSGGLALGREYFLDAARPGLAVFGLSASCRKIMPLRGCLSWHTRVAEIHRRRAGTRVGYAPGHCLTRDSLLGILPVGYAHGYPRLSRGPVLAGGRLVPVVGQVSMLTMVVDLTDVPGVRPGEPVTLIGSDGQQEVSVQMLCEGPDLIANLFTCMLGGRVSHHQTRTSWERGGKWSDLYESSPD